MKSHSDKVIHFHHKEIPKLGDYTCFYSLDCAINKGEHYYPQAFLRECKYIEGKVTRYINDNLSGISSDYHSDDCDEE